MYPDYNMNQQEYTEKQASPKIVIDFGRRLFLRTGT